jgi:hypothetical protein
MAPREVLLLRPDRIKESVAAVTAGEFPLVADLRAVLKILDHQAAGEH